MDPIEPPHHVGRQVECGGIPVRVHVIAHLLDQLGDKMRSGRFVLATADFYAAGPVVACVQADAFQRLAVKGKNEGWPQPKFASAVEGSPHGRNAGVELAEAVAYASPGITRSLPAWIADLSIEGADLRALGFIGDGQSHPLSSRFQNLASAQSVFPRATALTEEIDGHAIQRIIDGKVGSPQRPGASSWRHHGRRCTDG